MGACAGLALIGAIAGLVIPRRRKPAAAPPDPGAIPGPHIELTRTELTR
jgi:hypothetical protein